MTTTTTDAATHWNAHVSCRQMEIVLEKAGRAAVNASARQGRGKAELTCRFAGSPVRRFAGSPVRRFA
jgi:hypothetical protein